MPEGGQQSSKSGGIPYWIKDLGGGIVGGVGQCLVGHPFDTLKVRLQTQPQGADRLYNGTLDCVKKTLQGEGIGGLYKGVGSPLAGTAALVGVKFFSFGQAKKSLGDFFHVGSNLEIHHFFMAGSLAGFFTAFVEGPVDLFKSQMQVQIFRQKQLAMNGANAAANLTIFKNVFECAGFIASNYGIRGVYQGLQATILRNIQCNAWFFGFAEVTRRILTPAGKSPKDLPIYQQFMAGGIGGIFYWGLGYPFDVIKSSLQGDSCIRTERKYKSWADCFGKLYREGGVTRFYRGFVPCMLRSFPANAAAYGGWFVVSQKLLEKY